MSNDIFKLEEVLLFIYLLNIHAIGLFFHLTFIALEPKRIVQVGARNTDPVSVSHSTVLVHS